MGKKDEISIFSPWEKEKRYQPERKMKSPPQKSQKGHVSSMPKSRDHEHLEMYILSREKERLERYGATLGRRVKSIANSWKKSKARMYELQKEGAKVGKEGIEEIIQSGKKKEKKDNKGNIQKVEWNY
jgi:hypothetical protein